MKFITRHALWSMAVGVTLLFSAPAQARAQMNGPYYPMPAWDQKLPASNRFIVLSNWNQQAVLDRETGLVWERSPSTTKETWRIAHTRCINRTVGNRNGWRLPTVQELASLKDPTQPSFLPAGHPFSNVQADFYWSATADVEMPASAWSVDFATNGVADQHPTTFIFPIWCVRGGQGVDAQ